MLAKTLRTSDYSLKSLNSEDVSSYGYGYYAYNSTEKFVEYFAPLAEKKAKTEEVLSTLQEAVDSHENFNFAYINDRSSSNIYGFYCYDDKKTKKYFTMLSLFDIDKDSLEKKLLEMVETNLKEVAYMPSFFFDGFLVWLFIEYTLEGSHEKARNLLSKVKDISEEYFYKNIISVFKLVRVRSYEKPDDVESQLVINALAEGANSQSYENKKMVYPLVDFYINLLKSKKISENELDKDIFVKIRDNFESKFACLDLTEEDSLSFFENNLEAFNRALNAIGRSYRNFDGSTVDPRDSVVSSIKKDFHRFMTLYGKSLSERYRRLSKSARTKIGYEYRIIDRLCEESGKSFLDEIFVLPEKIQSVILQELL